MSKTLVTYATMSGSTAGAALAIVEELIHLGKEVDILPLEKVTDPASYGAIVIGAPMVMGWHRSALKFLRHHRADLQRIPLAIFVTALSLTSAGETEVNDVCLCIDGNLAKAPQNLHRPNLKERYSNIRRYASPILKAAQPSRPVSLAFFGGSLDYRRLKIPAMLFVMAYPGSAGRPAKLASHPLLGTKPAGSIRLDPMTGSIPIKQPIRPIFR